MRLATQVSGQGPDLLLLHGWGMNLAVWQPLVETLEEEFRITVVELPGHGASSWDPGCRSLDHWTAAVLDAAPSRAIWCGWSLGGLIAQRAAALAPERFSALVGMATSPCFVTKPDWPWAMETSVLERFASELEADQVRTLRRFLALQVQGAENSRATLQLLRTEFEARPAARVPALRAGLDLLLGVDLRNLPEPTGVSMHWLLGGRDQLVPPALASHLPGRVRVIRGAGHAPFLSHQEECAGILREWAANV
ncbi:pimeloyl-ACP methyl ester esterase BioH [Thiolapillus brandeum]|uniref:Pimeloyl-[acyl-carrier protein] methyl ester esterase n=1 Tax=Thiolapillus brandeum TaxID=1076588 RepID=A0A7U6JHY8_9GAMM|nr:pimeloyl-ACP methyl ester esterase BioH [Thiolapillus brandeum]BAO44964.1 biotin biosynthesis protein BioH [Thiolapillus brandeum]